MSVPLATLFRLSAQAARNPLALAASAGAVWFMMLVVIGMPVGSSTAPARVTRAAKMSAPVEALLRASCQATRMPLELAAALGMV